MLKHIIFLACLPLLFACSNQVSELTSWEEIKDKESARFQIPISEEKRNAQEQARTEQENKEQKFLSTWLETDTSISSIDINQVLWGWPAKDGIPGINNPKFLDIISAKSQMDYLTDDEMWLAIDIDWVQRFYPYAILVWHEIVNDSIGDNHFSVTFCPLCGSWIVFNRELDTGIVDFWVSGKLYQSNLLMYDSESESLWSQSIWEAVVWEKTWEKLEILKTNLMTFEQFTDLYPNWEVLSDDTGHSRNYGFIPYGWYDESDTLYFPVDNDDTRLHKKEILYIVNDTKNDTSVAFVLKDLVQEQQAVLTVDDRVYSAVYNDWLADITLDWEVLPGYYEMWFSWIQSNEWSKNIWKK